MAPTFFAQLAAGCLLVVGLSDIRNSGWKYLRLMQGVVLLLVLIANILLGWSDQGLALRRWRQVFELGIELKTLSEIGLVATMAVFIVWIIANVRQKRDRPPQRIWPLLAGLFCVMAAGCMACTPDSDLPGARLGTLTTTEAFLAIGSVVGGAFVLGGVTAGMLLGHRYLTDTDMPIAPLRRLTNIYLLALIVRLIWAAAMAWPIFGDTFRPAGGALWFWVVLTIRGGVGLIGAAIFAWMIRDCVKSRATQSATAIFYLSMVFVYLGELAAQYLLRTEGLAV